MRQSSSWLASAPVWQLAARSVLSLWASVPVPSANGSVPPPPPPSALTIRTRSTTTMPPPPPTARPRPPIPRRSCTWPVSRLAPRRNFTAGTYPSRETCQGGCVRSDHGPPPHLGTRPRRPAAARVVRTARRARPPRPGRAHPLARAGGGLRAGQAGRPPERPPGVDLPPPGHRRRAARRRRRCHLRLPPAPVGRRRRSLRRPPDPTGGLRRRAPPPARRPLVRV